MNTNTVEEMGRVCSGMGLWNCRTISERKIKDNMEKGARIQYRHYMAHPPSYPVGTGGCFPEGKAAGAW